jgi:predicted permease
MSDVRYALRGFRHSPGFTLIAILSLALGIGANTAIFSLTNAVLLRRLPVRDPDRLVVLALRRSDGFGTPDISQWMYQQIRDHSATLESFAAVATPPLMTLAGRDGMQQVQGEIVSGNYFDTLGVGAILGRVFTMEDDRAPGANPVCVISYGLWQRRFGGDPKVIGRAIDLNGRMFVVLGVTPQGFFGTKPGVEMDVRVPLMMFNTFSPSRVLNDPKGLPCCLGIGRLRAGVTAARAQAEIDAIYRHVNQETPPLMIDWDQYTATLREGANLGGLRESYGPALRLLMAVVGLVLLIACANVANLLMARASARRAEIAVRLALGAGRIHLMRQLLTESFLLAAAGSGIGILLAWWMDRTLVALAPHSSLGGQIAIDVNPDARVLLFTLAAAIAAALLFGFAPALQSARQELAGSLKTGRSGRGFAFSKTMAVAQVALSLVLLIGAGLFLRSLRKLKSVDPGFDSQHMVMLTINPSLNGYNDVSSGSAAQTILDRARRVPGVVSAAWARISPMAGAGAIVNAKIPGYASGEPVLWLNAISPDYFATLNTPLIEGRAFAVQDDRRNLVIVNQRAVAQFWPHEDAIGKHIAIGTHDCEVIGVVKDAKYQSLRQEIPATAYVPLGLMQAANFTLHARVSGDPVRAIAGVTREIRAFDRNLAMYNVTTMDAQIDDSLSLDRLMAMLTGLFGALAVTLAAMGLYGVMAFMVAARTREIGIRMALGADRARVLFQVLRESAVLALFGIAIGVPAALWASRAIASQLYGLRATDPLTYTAIAIALAAVALIAAWIPARRASNVDPIVALRYE